MQQKISESEAKWMKTIKDKEATIAKVTSEKEGLQSKVYRTSDASEACMNCDLISSDYYFYYCKLTKG